MSERGIRSGIGIGAFRSGGLLVDGGRGLETDIPPIISRMDFPQQWRILLVFDTRQQGVHRAQESMHSVNCPRSRQRERRILHDWC